MTIHYRILAIVLVVLLKLEFLAQLLARLVVGQVIHTVLTLE
jgi:hypothetical protein